jgi:hypothetical protein
MSLIETELGTEDDSNDSPPPIIAKLERAAILKSDGMVLFDLTEVGQACAKFEEAIALLSPLDQENCPSSNPEYLDLWGGAYYRFAPLSLAHLLCCSLHEGKEGRAATVLPEHCTL